MKESILKNFGWLVEEFNYLFKFKNRKYCPDDKVLANQIITCFSKNLDFTSDEKLNEMYLNTLKTLEDLYPMLLKST